MNRIRGQFNRADLLLLAINCILLTFLRAFLLPIYFTVPIMLYLLVPYKLKFNPLLLILYCAAVTILFIISNGFDLWQNNLLSIYVVFIIITMALSSPIDTYCDDERGNYIFIFVKFASYLMLLNNSIGFIQYILYPFFPLAPMRDDAFIGIYGKHGIGIHGMSLINGLLFLYYFFKYRQDKKKNTFLLFCFFLLSFIMGFYGMGLVIMIGTFIFYFLIVKKRIFLTFGLIIFIAFVCVFMYLIAPKTLIYNYKNIERFTNFTQHVKIKREKASHEIPRKLYAYYYYYEFYSKDLQNLLLGTGPGTFNSRTSFLLNGDYSPGNPFEQALGVHKPYLAEKYIYPLWARSLVFKAYHDGTRNEPFSSVVSVLAEYGLVFFILVCILFYLKIKYILKRFKLATFGKEGSAIYLAEFLTVASLFIFFNLFLDNLLEFTEMLFFVLLFKLIEIYSIFVTREENIASYG